MAKVVCIHGIAQEFEAAEVLASKWAPALCGGVSNADGSLSPSDVAMCFYGDLFRPQETQAKDAASVAPVIEDPFEHELLAALDDDAAGPDVTKTLGARTVQAMLHRVADTPFFGGCAQEVVIRALKQVWWYVTNRNQTRALGQHRLRKVLTNDTRVLVGHSLGSVIAYEVLCAEPQRLVRTLVTLGSPLGIPALAPRLEPPATILPARWPAGVLQWFNIADKTDIVALEKKLSRIFGPNVHDALVNNGPRIHDVIPYLTAAQTGRAILAGLALEEAGR